MSYRTRHVANALLVKARESNRQLTPMHVQKLLYFMHGWHLALTGENLVDEPFEAWAYGPVIDSVYRELKPYGRSPVTSFISEGDPTSPNATRYLMVSKDDQQFWSLLDRVWGELGHFNAVELSAMSHVQGSPWETTRTAGREHGDNSPIIDNGEIERYFRALAEQRQATGRVETA
ncbi:Panacea domain-containing protein [Thiomonas sp. FB-6]|uniref:Panacea domain-containing protein n=1 Tax=Thiomonas sp. FB-6 TaxID=1158291 RepID=UPI00037E016C|nr:type II toxin-antitoxin system antitoxin SocA domain-containing protein [Thiomonas sp. FB-6]